MNWEHLLALPSTLLFALAAVLCLLALATMAGSRRHWQARRRLRASLAAGLALAWLVLTIGSFTLGWSLRGYRKLVAEIPVVTIDARILSPQRWALTLSWPDGSSREVDVAGDAFRIEAIVLKWKLPALLAGAPPVYRLDRIEGRYDDARQEQDAPRTVLDFSPGRFDLLALRKAWPGGMPGVDVVYGSGAFLPLVDGGHYQVNMMRTGALVARPDAATSRRLQDLLR
ncbi:MAG: hypothetical protein KGN77_04640 [Xanthomonadaceae bacterium]|nr:hypothetical protein [Xanthomonadaceae bacterium]MDE1964216.1 hypothetical protein [Xanthomonadaceae bacterium]